MQDMQRPGEGPEDRHGYRDIGIRAIILFALGLLATSVAIIVVLAGFMEFFSDRQSPGGADTNRPPAAVSWQTREPMLQVDPAGDTLKMQRDEVGALDGYGWVDREAGVVRIPIDRAMDLLAERGLPTRDDGSPRGGRGETGGDEEKE